MINRAYNFGAGPAMLPEPILKEAQKALLNFEGTGQSILEIGHRTDEFMALLQSAEAKLRLLLGIPDAYNVLFLGMPARAQFSMVPMNLIPEGKDASYLVSGVWSKMAFDEAQKLSSAFLYSGSESLSKDAAFLYYTPNETVDGIRIANPPESHGVPIVADMTSCLLSEPLNIEEYGLIFAGAQKNIANAGLSLVIVRNDLVERSKDKCLPTYFDYKTHVLNRSLYATPPTFNCYLADKMFDWVKAQGGVQALYQVNLKKAAALYEYIDESKYYVCGVEPSSRSLMNVCFSIKNKSLEQSFLNDAAKVGLVALKGHKLVGGLRASLYNAMPMEGVISLIEFMRKFAKENPL